MPDPTAHADDMKSPAKPETLSPYWWLNPWRAAIQQANFNGIHRAWWLSTDKQLCKTAVDLAGAKLKADVTERAILDTANEAGFQASKVGYVINGEPTSPFPLKWLGEAVAYWKGEAYSARKQRDEAKELADYHRNNLNTFQRKVELTLKPACPHLYEDTIGYVQWAVDEIKSQKVSFSVMTEDRDEYIEKLDRERGTHEATLGYVRQLEEKVNHLEAKWPRDLWNGGKIYGDVYTCEPHAKAKRKVLAEDKTTGKKLLAPKKKAKKKGGRRG